MEGVLAILLTQATFVAGWAAGRSSTAASRIAGTVQASPGWLPNKQDEAEREKMWDGHCWVSRAQYAESQDAREERLRDHHRMATL